MKRNRKRRHLGQTLTEYILIIAVVVVAAIGILSIFSQTVREKIAGAVLFLDPDNEDVDAEMQQDSREIMEQLGTDNQN